MTTSNEQKIQGSGARAPKKNSEQIRANLATAAAALEILPDAERAVDGLEIDGYDLAEFLACQGDPCWLRPKPMRRWAELISERGFPQ